jgi:hypothetical protein
MSEARKVKKRCARCSGGMRASAIVRCAFLAATLIAAAALSLSTARAESPTELFEQAFTASQSGNFAEAERLYKLGLQQEGGAANVVGLAHYYLAEAMRQQGKNDADVLYHYKQAARLIPETEQGADAALRAESIELSLRQPGAATPAADNPAMRPSTFQKTCTGIRYTTSKGKPAVTAHCRAIDQRNLTTTLVLAGISNIDGKLTQGLGDSSFHLSCENISIGADGDSVTLSAVCRRIDGTKMPTSLPLQAIENKNGRLSY